MVATAALNVVLSLYYEIGLAWASLAFLPKF